MVQMYYDSNSINKRTDIVDIVHVGISSASARGFMWTLNVIYFYSFTLFHENLVDHILTIDIKHRNV